MSVRYAPSIQELASNADNALTVCFRGILARPGSQFEPLLPWLPGRVVGYQDLGNSYDHAEMCESVLWLIDWAVVSRTPVTLLGASMGGMEIPFVIEAWRARHPGQAPTWLRRVIMVDAPNGAATMKELPNWAAPLLISRPTGALLSSGFGDWVVNKMTKPPRPEEVAYPSKPTMRRVIGSVLTKHEWQEYVQQQAREGLSGYSGSLWWSWLHWMVSVGNDGSYARACGALRGTETWYLPCTHEGNVTVDQPAAYEWHAAHIDGLKKYAVHAVHCGFLQQPDAFMEAFDHIIH